ncbi:Gfo/Idh/MocA family protein [Tsukamurella paurometabola]
MTSTPCTYPYPNALHHHWIEACLESGKHVLAEKPLTTSAGATAALVDLAAARGLVLQENFAFLRHGQHRTVRALVNEGRIGELRHFHSEFCFPPLAADDVRYRARPSAAKRCWTSGCTRCGPHSTFSETP